MDTQYCGAGHEHKAHSWAIEKPGEGLTFYRCMGKVANGGK